MPDDDVSDDDALDMFGADLDSKQETSSKNGSGETATSASSNGETKGKGKTFEYIMMLGEKAFCSLLGNIFN